MIEIYEYDGTNLQSVAIFDNGVVSGNTEFANRLESWVEQISLDEVEYSEAIEVGLQHRYNSAAYQTERS